MTERKTVASAHARIDLTDRAQEDHERLCAERYGTINEKIDDLKDGMKWVIRLALALLLSVTGWLSVQVWDGNKADLLEGRNALSRDRMEASQARLEARP